MVWLNLPEERLIVSIIPAASNKQQAGAATGSEAQRQAKREHTEPPTQPDPATLSEK